VCPDRDPPVELPEDVVAALVQGNKIEAIKRLRVARGIGLKDAKDIVDAYVPSDPVVRARLAEAQAKSRRGCLTYLRILLAIAFIVGALIRTRG
jgi:ribosomal protein L7/L12